jgi:outer membrane receptor protein involved in Fe transport
LASNPIAGFPDLMGTLRLQYQREQFTSSVSMKYVGSFYTDNFKNSRNKNDAYTVVNADVMYALPLFDGSTVMLRGEVRNLLNTLYMQTGEGEAFFPAAERNCIVGATIEF